MLFTEWTHPNKIAYNMQKSDVRVLHFIMDRSNLHCLVYGFTKRMLSRSNTHQIYVQLIYVAYIVEPLRLPCLYTLFHIFLVFFLSLFGPN
jgi:hypothetical protein